MGKLFVISAPSGAGKTSLVRALLAERPKLALSVSHTTRRPRAHERDGRDYHFVTPEQFQALADRRAFLEHARVFGNCYGTSRSAVQAQLDADRDVLLEIDWQGARQVRAAMPGCVTVFILPPSRQALEQRLRARGTDDAEAIEHRLSEAVEDMSHWREFDYVVVNDRFDQAALELGRIVDGSGQSLRTDRPAVGSLVEALLAG